MIRPQPNFAGGELDPALHGRTDQVKYQTGAELIENFTILKSGGLANRPGTQFVGEVKDSTKPVALIPFIFNESDEDQNYILEFGHEYIRFHQDGDQVTETAKVITAISKEPEAIITFSAAHSLSVGDEVYLSAILGMTELNNRNFKVADIVSTTTIKFKYMYGPYVDTSAFTTYSSAGTAERIYTVTSPYDSDDLAALSYTQSLDVVTIVHPSYAPRELTRTGHASWVLATITFAPEISAPSNLAHSGSNGTTSEWVVTSIDEDTYEESLATNTVGANAEATESAPITLTWTALSGAAEYNVYKYRNGLAGFIGIAGETTFIDDGFDADTTDNPPVNRSLFTNTTNWPSSATYYQERLVLARDGSVYTSRVRQYKNYTFSPLLFVDDAVTFAIQGRQTSLVRNMVEVGGTLVIFANSGEIIASGDGSGILTPNDVNLKRISENGSSSLRPQIIGADAIYMQERGSSVMLLTDDGGTNLSTFAAHLLRGYSVVDWALQKTPDTTLWMVRSDGLMIAMTFLKEHAIVGWHRHSSGDGEYENVATIPEDDRDAVYVTVKRTVNGRSVRYIEQMASRNFGSDIRDAKFMDCHLSYDGRNTNELDKVVVTGGTGDWDTDQDLTLTSDSGIFKSTDVGNAIHLEDEDQTAFVRLEIKSYTSANVVTVRGDRDVPAALQGVSSWRWVEAVDVVSGLWHIEGEEVSVMADGYVLASPNNPMYSTLTVTNGTIELDEPYGVIHVGLPYVSNLKTLAIDTASGKLQNQMKLVPKVLLKLYESRGLLSGEKFPDDDGTSGLSAIKEKDSSDSNDEPPPLVSATKSVDITSSWNMGGQVVCRQVDPLPVTILSVSPVGHLGG